MITLNDIDNDLYIYELMVLDLIAVDSNDAKAIIKGYRLKHYDNRMNGIIHL